MFIKKLICLLTAISIMPTFHVSADTNTAIEAIKEATTALETEYVLKNNAEAFGINETDDLTFTSHKIFDIINENSDITLDTLKQECEEAQNEALALSIGLPENRIYYYRLYFPSTGEIRVVVNKESAFSSYSTYGFASFDLKDKQALKKLEFKLYLNKFAVNRNGGYLYLDKFTDTLPATTTQGEYTVDSDEYAAWKTYFSSRKSDSRLCNINSANFPEIVNNNTASNYSGYITKDVSNKISGIGDNNIIAFSNSAGDNVAMNYYLSMLYKYYGMYEDTNGVHAIEAVNNAFSSDNLYAALVYYSDFFNINLNTLRHNKKIAETLYNNVQAGTLYDAQTLKAAFENEVKKYIVSYNGQNFDITDTSPQTAMTMVNSLTIDSNPNDVLTVIRLANYSLGIDEKYINKIEQMNEEDKTSAAHDFASIDYNDTESLVDRFCSIAYDYDTLPTEKPLYRNDFENEYIFAKYFLSLIRLDDEKFNEVKNLYDLKKYKSALVAYRNILLDDFRTADMTGLMNYLDNIYNDKSQAKYLIDGSGTETKVLKSLKSANIVGSPYTELNPLWDKLLSDGSQSDVADISLFSCFSPLAAMYYDNGDKQYLDKWMQIADCFCFEHKRWFEANVTGDPRIYDLCWSGGAQAMLNMGDRVRNILCVLGIFAKTVDRPTRPSSWSNVLGSCDVLQNKSAYDNINSEIFADIILSLTYDHAPGLANMYENSGAVPNQRLNGLVSLALTDRFFGNVIDYGKYATSAANGLTSSAEDMFSPDGGMCEQAFNYNMGSLNLLSRLYSVFDTAPDYIQTLKENEISTRKLFEGISYPNGSTPTVGLGAASAQTDYLGTKSFTSVAFPYIGFYTMRSGFDADATNLFMQSPRRTRGHLYPSSNAIELYSHGRLLLMNGGAPWYYQAMAPSDQLLEYSQYNAYFNESSSMNRNTVIVDGNSQSREDLSGHSGNARKDTTGQKWFSSDSFDYVCADYDGGYGNVQGYNHNRSVTYVKDADMFVVDDAVSSNKDISECEAIWNFKPYLTAENDGVDVDGFSEDEVNTDTENRLIRTSSQTGANVSLYQFYPGNLQYNKYYGYKGEDGYKGFYANAFARRYPKVDIHVSWQEKGNKIPLVTLIEPMTDTETKIHSYNDISELDSFGGYSAFCVTTDNCIIYHYSGNSPRTYGDFNIECKSLTAVIKDNETKLIVNGAVNEKYKDFVKVNGIETPILSPSGFSWETNEEGTYPSYLYTAPPEVSDVHIEGIAYSGSSLSVAYNYADNGIGSDSSKYQWYSSSDGVSWQRISDANGKTYRIPYYKLGSSPIYYTASVTAASSDMRSGNTEFADSSDCSSYFMDDFEGSIGTVYGGGTVSDGTHDNSVTKELKTEDGNSYLHFVYQSAENPGEAGIGTNNPFISRYWKNVDRPFVLKCSVRKSGTNATLSLRFLQELVSVTGDYKIKLSGNGSYLKQSGEQYALNQNEWYDISCTVNICDFESNGIPAKSYIVSVKNRYEDNWVTSDIIPLPNGNYTINDGTQTNGGNRIYVYLGSDTKESYDTLDVDNFGIVPIIYSKLLKYTRNYSEETDNGSYVVELTNNDSSCSKEVNLIIGVYSENKLLQAKLQTVSLEPAEIKTINFASDIEKDYSDKEIKLFILGNDCSTPLKNVTSNTVYYD